MIQNTQIPHVLLAFFKKVISYDNGALLLLSTASGGLFTETFKIIFHGVEQRDLILPMFFSSSTFFLYSLVFIGDFFTGLRASRHEAKEEGRVDFIKSQMLWRSFWKFFGVIVILFVLTIFCMMLLVFNNGLFYNVFLIAIPSVMLMVILFEFHSIGENIKRRFGYKPSYFEFFDRLSKAVEQGIISKITNWFK